MDAVGLLFIGGESRLDRLAVEGDQSFLRVFISRIATGEHKGYGNAVSFPPMENDFIAVAQDLGRDAWEPAAGVVFMAIDSCIVDAEVDRFVVYDVGQVSCYAFEVILGICDTLVNARLLSFVVIKIIGGDVHVKNAWFAIDDVMGAASAVGVEIKDEHALGSVIEGGAGGGHQAVERAERGPLRTARMMKTAGKRAGVPA